ncbi:MAG: prepilin-type N-terminal cleavage/methylation domain-containing protein [Kofleriaceae bacterium]|nr:prepilin-type N-terminal cleavage/methylation domain-containing protein [Kofleriaceae bacterium]
MSRRRARARAGGRVRAWGRRAGFTLIEVMVSLVVSALLVGMVLSIFSRMSLAYRGQQAVAELQQILAAAHGLIEADLRQAGFQMPDGFFLAGDQRLRQPVELVNDADGFGPDQLRVFYADASAQARVVDFNGAADTAADPFTTITVDDAGDFVAGDAAVIVKVQDGAPADVRFYACVVGVAAVAPTVLTLATGGTWGSADNDQCDQVRTDAAIGTDSRAMVYRFRARAYRIDPTRRALAVLQVSPTAGLAADWQDLAVGFTDLQVASRWDDSADPAAAAVDTDDLDTDPVREWYSGEAQETLSAPITTSATPYVMASYFAPAVPVRPVMVGVRVTMVVRTHSKVDVLPSAATPNLVDAARPDHNDLGDRAAVTLEGVADGARPDELRGEHVYRYSTVGTDLRNMGVGL